MRFDGEDILEIYSSQNGEQLCYAVSFGRNICMSFFGGDELIKVEITPNGDANGDKSTDICDIIELSLSLENGTNVKNQFGADVTKDEILNIGDVNVLREILLDLPH